MFYARQTPSNLINHNKIHMGYLIYDLYFPEENINFAVTPPQTNKQTNKRLLTNKVIHWFRSKILNIIKSAVMANIHLLIKR